MMVDRPTHMVDYPSLVNSIQSAVAPVFMLTAVAHMINVLASRLARIIDRARWIEVAKNANIKSTE